MSLCNRLNGFRSRGYGTFLSFSHSFLCLKYYSGAPPKALIRTCFESESNWIESEPECKYVRTRVSTARPCATLRDTTYLRFRNGVNLTRRHLTKENAFAAVLALSSSRALRSFASFALKYSCKKPDALEQSSQRTAKLAKKFPLTLRKL